MEIPGFYYDETKRKYFKITSNTTVSHKYNSNVIKQEKRENERAIKRAKLEDRQSISSNPRFKLKLYSNLDLKLNGFDLNRRKFEIEKYCLQNIEKRNCTTTRVGGYHSDKIEKIIYDDLNKWFSFSSNKSIYEVKLNEMVNKDGDEFLNYKPIIPILKTTRNDKKDSILRDFNNFKQSDNTSTLIKTWQGVGNEPSEVEISTKINQTTFKSYSIKKSNRESFNTSFYNNLNNNLIICGSKHCFKQSMCDLSKQDEVIFKGLDVLTADYKTSNVYLLGTRSGQALVIDDRMNNKNIHKIKKQQQNSGNGSVINIKKINGDRVLCSFLGSKLKLFDIRLGFKNSIVDYNSTKTVEDVFGETLGMINDTNFIVQTKSSFEIFDIMNPYPIKSLNISRREDTDTRMNNNVIDSCVFTDHHSKINNGIIMTNGEDFDIYS
ncbi:hypothetical protein BN7_310 [Wickerhamomyces ciferrii]|uniref:Uncharacterized protein n=1 Tax=Wickerhamomyces ciferrii (strain ATCC 14091 / BCRC 22168 / CBS 111 / JCM 3599 / NBRC 0793 / NRRL Y-1031 F-60-10) TaxID=1206466 RepID=K0KD24_WICCF|nr:uncharacterized protein BN7_310 [Wickerhamomyces ciferrii]CCH40776.1 hypothetical protein BN7_310 [Wickerhamomyces ciferrii]